MKNVTKGKGTARVEIVDENGIARETFLKDALFIPSFQNDIFSVKAATKRGAQFYFGKDCGSLKADDGTSFPIKCKRGLYFLVQLKSNLSVFSLSPSNSNQPYIIIINAQDQDLDTYRIPVSKINLCLMIKVLVFSCDVEVL